MQLQRRLSNISTQRGIYTHLLKGLQRRVPSLPVQFPGQLSPDRQGPPGQCPPAYKISPMTHLPHPSIFNSSPSSESFYQPGWDSVTCRHRPKLARGHRGSGRGEAESSRGSYRLVRGPSAAPRLPPRPEPHLGQGKRQHQTSLCLRLPDGDGDGDGDDERPTVCWCSWLPRILFRRGAARPTVTGTGARLQLQDKSFYLHDTRAHGASPSTEIASRLWC